MHSVKAVFDGEKVKFLEPVQQNKPCNVIVTFIDEETENDMIRNYPADENAFSFWMMKEEDLYQDYQK